MKLGLYNLISSRAQIKIHMVCNVLPLKTENYTNTNLFN